LAAARAVIWASLVDDPSSLPEQFPTEEEQNAERERLFKILVELIKWENTNNQIILKEAKAEIKKSTNGSPPALLDPFAGGGSIPLEAQRLGLEAHAIDLNPVAVMINKAMIEIPPKFTGQPPVNPDSRRQIRSWCGAQGLAEDVQYYGEWMKQKALERIGNLYPKVKDKNGQEHTVIAWIWARTVKCPNPVCGCEMPLVSSFVLSKRKGKESYIQPILDGNSIYYAVKYGKESPAGTMLKRNGAECIFCHQPVGYAHIKAEGNSNRLKHHLMAIITESDKGRSYFSPDSTHFNASQVQKPDDCPDGEMPKQALGFVAQLYGPREFKDLFTNRQLVALTTFSNLVTEAYDEIIQHGASDLYARSICVYLAFAVDRLANRSSTVCTWDVTRDSIKQTFGMQTLPITWDFAEANIFSSSTGSWKSSLEWIPKCLYSLPLTHMAGFSSQSDARNINMKEDVIVSTDPPYYDNIGYADLSDFFYVWMRRSLKIFYPEVFKTLLVPKTEELVANPYRFEGGKSEAKRYFEFGMSETFRSIYTYAKAAFPVTVFYAFKQTENESGSEGTSSTGWETMLSALISAGFTITGTWPYRTEGPAGLRNIGRNALASSIVLVCRKRITNSSVCTRRDFINALKRELKPALRKLQDSNIAPVDLAQSAIGPGMGVFSRFTKVLEADGTPMDVRSALQIINQELDLYFSEQDVELDRDSSFCLDLYSQYSFNRNFSVLGR